MQKVVSQGFRLSPQQEHVWHALQSAPAGLLVVQARFVISGELDRRRLVKAVETVVERQEILRTRFPLLPSLSIPVQAIEDSADVSWHELDLAGRPEDLDPLCEDIRAAPFDLANGPLLRLHLMKLAPGRHALLLTQPALCADAASLDLLVAEIVAAYHGDRAEGDIYQYADLAELLHEWQGSPPDDPGPAFWRKQDVSALPRLIPRRAGLPETHPSVLLSESRRIERACVAAAGSLPQVLLAAWMATLHRSIGDDEIVVGTLFDGRTCQELEGALGLFARHLPVRLQLTPASTLAQVLPPLSATLAEVSSRQDFFSSASIARLLAEHGGSGWPFGFDCRRPREMPSPHDGPGFTLDREWVGIDRFNLRLSILDDGVWLRVTLQAEPGLFRPEETQSILSRYIKILDGLLLGLPIGEIDVLTEAERRQVEAFNRTEGEIASGLLAHQLFEEHARSNPHRPALVHAGATWTYGELSSRANRLAHSLIASGIGPGHLVGICLKRSPELIAAVLGTLKAGAAYLPLDPTLPPGRLAWMAEDARLSLLLTREPLRHAFSSTAIPVLRLEAVAGQLPLESEVTPAPLCPADLAYVLYTSGSTGNPKGVMIPHRGLVNYLLWARETYASAEGAGAPVHSSIGFDLTVTSLLVPLSAGTAVALLEEDGAAEALVDALRSHEDFSLVKLTPAHLDLLRRELLPEEYEGRTRALVIGGEALRAESLALWRERAPRTRLINEYGPTEATVGCCTYEVRPGDSLSGPVAIGRPIANTRLYVVGPGLQLAPFEAPGELWIGGEGLARGYLGRPELTAERFVPDPFHHEPDRAGARLYRSGDLVRLRMDGNLEFLGRVDNQVKVRGYRIEPGEIEAALLSREGAREAVAVAIEDAGGTALVAFVTGSVDAEDLRRHVASRLPEFMVPSRIAVLPELPLTGNGKVDRKELARSWRERIEAGAETEPPALYRTWTEELLAGMFGEVLGLSRVSPTESFFSLGGHSLLATQVVSRVREAFGVEISLRTFFEVPSVAALAARVDALRAEGEGVETPPLVPVSRNRPLPLSFAQQRLWFIDQLAPGSPLYNIPVALRIDGPLRIEVLELCLTEIVRRHEALRTIFASDEGTPTQLIQPPALFRLPVVDLSGIPQGRREGLARTLVGEESVRPFDLARGPLLRGALLRLADREHAAMLTLHHIVGDGWSLGILVREITALYAAFDTARLSPLADLPVQYADFSVWQRSWLTGDALEQEIAFWRRQLDGLPPKLKLSTDRPRPAVQSFRGRTLPLRIPARVVRLARALSRREGATLFMVLMAAFQALLSRSSEQEDFAVGTPIAGRNRLETEGLIGFFVNTLVLRADLSGEPSFLALLSRVRDTALSAHAHQDIPFEKLVQELMPERSLAHTPLFQVILALQNSPVERLEIQRLSLRPLESGGTTAKFDLTLLLEEHDAELMGTVEFATDLFDATTIERLVCHYEHLLTEALDQPDLVVTQLSPLPASERHQMLVEWNDVSVAAAIRGEDTLIHEPFELWAERTPGAVAVVCGDEHRTFGQLDAQADRLARQLIGLGIGPGSLVGVHLRRSVEMIPALLAILKAGAAYVPLEIGHPTARLQWILHELGITCLLTDQAQLTTVQALSASVPTLTDVLYLDRPGSQAVPPTRPPRLGTPDDLAYIIFTSGSTGTPKGVMVRHRPVVNLLNWAHRTFAFSPRDRVLFITSLSFDLSVFDIFGLLGAGGSIRIANEQEIRDPQSLVRALSEEPITFWDSAPAALEQTVPFLGTLERHSTPTLRLAFLSGDWIPVALPDRVRASFPEARVVALGGATEATVWSNVFPVDRVDPGWVSIPYGRPIDNARYHVLDGRLSPCPIGVPGDLHIGGDCLADGYVREPELTAKKFIPDPWSSRPGARLYRTGDRARYRADGNLEFLGRLDHQVKIRGFRIELGEIETALASMEGVREAVVVVREDNPGNRILVAYVAGDFDAAELRRSLQDRLPDYMVPTAFVALPALPLTANGKVDRKALPAPDRQRAEEDFTAPRTPVETGLAAIWAGILGLANVGAEDNFFDLGGHSLLATRMLAAVREAFQVELPLRLLFERPILEELARAIEAARDETAAVEAPVVALAREPGVNRFPVSFPQLREWILDRLEPGNPAYNISSPLRIEGPLSVPILDAALQGLLRRHEVLRTRFEAGDEEPVQAVLPEVRLEVRVVDLSALPEPLRQSELERQVRSEAAIGFDLSVAPLLRTSVVRLGAEDHAVLLTVHHIVSDGWSMGILSHELGALYEAAARSSSSTLPPLPVQYADYAAWQRERLSGNALERQSDFWRRRLAGVPHLELPTDRPRPAVRSSRGGEVPVLLPPSLGERLNALARQQGSTLFMALLAGFQCLLGRWSGQDDVVVGTYRGNRPRRELEGLIGFFINTLVLRTRLEDSSFASLLGRVREGVLEAYTHGEMPFEKLLEVLQVPRDPSRAPILQVLLVLQNFPPIRADLSPGVRMSSLPLASGKVDYDLELWLGEGPDGIDGSLKYNADLFDEASLVRFAAQLQRLLEAAALAPDASLWTLPLIAESDQAQLLGWSRGPVVPPGSPLLHHLIEEQAARTPGGIALEAGAFHLTYGQMTDRARRQASQLCSQGVGSSSIVALPAERSADLIVSMLAVLQAGAAYLPLDPSYPQERRDFMREDSGAIPIPPLSGDLESPVPEAAVDPAEAAYVIYTSGSTGQPKGVVVPHHAIASFVRGARDTYGLTAGDRVLQFASLSFDTSAEEIWPALAAGATLVLRPDDMAESIPHFLREVERLRLTVLDLPTSFWHEMVAGLEADDLRLPRCVRLVILGGEEALADRLAVWRRRVGSSVRLANTYGPTETTIVATRSELSDLAAGELVPIGRPIAGARALVLDRFFSPVPPGVRGELWVGGAGVARGYLGRPALTAERFLPDPFAGPAEAGARLYRTGDLAILRPDGDLLFAGRTDHQLKIRGYRIEPGEIEAVLRLHPALRDAIVDAHGEGDGRRLVAWIVPREGVETPETPALRAFLRDRLPEPWVPAAFVPLKALPLTPSGKIDRHALPEPSRARPGARSSEPRNALERVIAQVYGSLLQVDRIDLHDNFFDLGGHSLLIVRAHQQLKQALGREIPVIDLFRFPTVSALARHLGGAEKDSLPRTVQTLADQQRAAQQRQKAAMEALKRGRGPILPKG